MAIGDTDAVQRLWSARFGGAPTTQQNWITAALDDSHSAVGLVAGAPPGDTVVGLSLLDVGDRAYTRRYLGLDALGLHPPLADRNGLLHLSCVHADWERRGIGTAFYERRLAILRERDVPRAFGISWHRPHTVDSRVLFEKHGFTGLASVERYYARTTPRPHCPDCDGPCTCTASLYARSLASAPRFS
jgi:GNAT superfamily N-acetyltransferase